MSDLRIKEIFGREILDSRGNPTVEATVILRSGAEGIGRVPSGASTGAHEALELRDGDKKRFGGAGVLSAVRNVNTVLRRKIIGMDAGDLRAIDRAMIALDGTANKKKLGANAILGISLAALNAGATGAKVPLYRWIRRVYGLPQRSWRLPLPMMNVMNGGAHAGWSIDLQECMIIPRQKKFSERLRAGSEIFHVLGGLLKKTGFQTLVGDEGGYAPKLKGNEAALKLIMRAIKTAGYAPGREVALGMDAAASEFFDAKKKLYLMKSDQRTRRPEEMIALYERWIKKYPLISIEDPLAEDDWASWRVITKKLGKKIKLVGDDLFVTNVSRLRQGLRLGAANAILIKLNQIGTMTETIEAITLAQKNGYAVAVSHRSGETADTTIADLSVAVNAEYIKTGSLSRSERIEKYNRLTKIEEELAGKS
jgi:enolase